MRADAQRALESLRARLAEDKQSEGISDRKLSLVVVMPDASRLPLSHLDGTDKVSSIYEHVEARLLEMDLKHYRVPFELLRQELGAPLLLLQDREASLDEAGVLPGTLLRVRMDDV